MKRIVDEAIKKVRSILVTRKDDLIALSERLLEVEVLDAEDLKDLFDELASPRLVPGTDASLKSDEDADGIESGDSQDSSQAEPG